MTTAGGQTLSYTYDALKRHTATTVAKNGSTIFRVAKAYYNHATDSTRTTAQVQYYNVRNSAGTLIAGSQYVYDKLGNIIQIKESESPYRVLVAYDYDALNQLTKETTYTYSGTSTTVNTTTVNRFEYDTAGNLLRVYDSATATEPVDKYTYGDQDWQDLLTKFNGTTINYDASGNPLNWYNGNTYTGLTWTMGRQLESLTMETDTENIGVSYTYDMSGMRSSKTVVYGVGEAHSHEYTSSVTAPTCTTAGFTTYTCDCGESYVDNLVDALGHNYVQSGNVYTCSRCGDSYTGHEHSYTEETTQPTCTTAGYTVYTCSCGDSYTVDIPALGHNYVLVGQSGNVATYECSRCGHRYTAVIPVDPNPPVEYSLRSSNTVTEHHKYIYASGKLMRETITTTSGDTTTTQVLDFVYGSGSTPLALVYTNGTASPVTYYYVTNMQGDVVKLVRANGTTVASYAYDAWGKVLSATGSMAEVNPIRYRGYYYDAETELYYLQSRYYDSAVKRFINADGITSTGQGFLGHNMFAYCGNNPVVFSDSTGHCRRAIFYETTDGEITFLESAGATLSGLFRCKMPYCETETYTYSSAEEFIECWNSLSGTYDEIIVFTHGYGGSAALWFSPANEFLHVTGGKYNFSMLNPVDLDGEMHLNVCYAAKNIDNNSIAQAFADLTGGKVIASEGKVHVCPLYGISIAVTGWESFWPRKHANTVSPSKNAGNIRKHTGFDRPSFLNHCTPLSFQTS